MLVKALKTEFLDHIKVPSENVIGVRDGPDFAKNYAEDLQNLVNSQKLKITGRDGLPRIDLCVLGMGTDGHIAALYPHHEALQDTSEWVLTVKSIPKPRITLGLHVLNNCKNKFVALAGASKAVIAELVLKGR